jgi:polyisoprenoid-binding protein YceI
MFTPRKVVILAVIAAVIVVGVGGWWFFLRDDAPDKASADSVRETLDEETEGESASGTVDGTWTIDSSVGSFDDFSGNWAGYRIDEELGNIGANTAVGRTPDVTGSITIAGNKVSEGSFEVNMTTLKSDKDLRDGQMKGRGLQTDTFPTATFRLTDPLTLPDNATSGGEVPFSAKGELTLHGVTKSVTLDLTAQFASGKIGINGSAPVTLADYDIEKPVGFSVVSVADGGTFEFQLYLSQSS